MTFLKKLGMVLLKVVNIATGMGPLVTPFLGGGAAAKEVGVAINDLTQISQIVVMTEAVLQQPGSGAAKLASSTPLVLNILRTSQAFAGKKIANEALAEQGAAKIVSGVADFMNAIHPDEVKTS